MPDGGKAARKSLAASWTLLTEYFPNDDLYRRVAEANLEPAKTKPLEEAFILWMKNKRASVKQ